MEAGIREFESPRPDYLGKRHMGGDLVWGEEYRGGSNPSTQTSSGAMLLAVGLKEKNTSDTAKGCLGIHEIGEAGGGNPVHSIYI